MRPLTARQLLDIWERGRHARPWQQALLLLSAACPEQDRRELARLSIDRRDGMLSTLRQWTFGTRLTCLVDCPSCGERLEFRLKADDIGDEASVAPETVEFHGDGYRVVFRLPNSEDLAALGEIEEPDAARSSLLARCLVNVSAAGAAAVPDREPADSLPALPPALQEAIVQEMRAAAPRADLRIGLNCPACDHGWEASFDIVSFFWAEIDDWARRTLREIHILAGAYGWSEGQILDISAWRRQIYLEMVQA